LAALRISLSFGIVAAIVGVAIGGVMLGGAAVGGVAIDGGAVNYYACGGKAYGHYAIEASRRDPEAQMFFRCVGAGKVYRSG
jgi:hypothetical protein